MLKSKQLTLALLVNAALISTAFASEQSESKGFVEDAEGSVLFRTGYINRDKKAPGVKDQSSAAQSAIFDLESGYTKGVIGFGIGAVGDASFKLGENKNAGNNMIPRETLNGKKQAGDTYDHWARGGANVKARISNTEVRYGTQVLDLPVLASNTGRMVPEYFEGVLATSREINGLELTAGKFTKNQMSEQINTDGNHLESAVVWGAKYKFSDALNASYYGLDSKNKLDRHYVLIKMRKLILQQVRFYRTMQQQALPVQKKPIIFGRSQALIILARTTSCWHTNKIPVMLAMIMAKMRTVSKAFTCRTHTCLTLSATMKNQYKYSTT